MDQPVGEDHRDDRPKAVVAYDHLIERPSTAADRRERARQWAEWFGVGRLLLSAGAVLIVCAGMYWLVRSPTPPTEAGLPVATTTTSPAGRARTDTTDSVAPVGVEFDGAPASSATDGTVTVHVAGAVVRPGLVELPGSARVADAIRAAGGAVDGGDAGRLNLAAILVDGSRIYVPMLGEGDPAVEVPVERPAEVTSPGTSSASAPVDVNTADAAALDELPGVGPATAAAIVTERDTNGPFVTVDDLDRVPGIGPAKLAALRDLVTT